MVQVDLLRLFQAVRVRYYVKGSFRDGAVLKRVSLFCHLKCQKVVLFPG
jgi:hypothetical protein